jgi:hypothetical protein
MERRTRSVEGKGVYVKDERQANAGQAVEAVSAAAAEAEAGVGVRQAGLDVASRRWRESSVVARARGKVEIWLVLGGCFQLTVVQRTHAARGHMYR